MASERSRTSALKVRVLLLTVRSFLSAMSSAEERSRASVMVGICWMVASMASMSVLMVSFQN